MFPPVILFAYNRPEHTRRTLEALAQNQNAPRTEVVAFVDGAKPGKPNLQSEVIAAIEGVQGFGKITVHAAPQNRGLANSVIGGVTDVMGRCGRGVIVEDDIITSPLFLEYMRLCLDKYEIDPRIWAVSGYAPPVSKMTLPASYPHDVFLSPRYSSWGWGTWKDRWDKAVFDRDFFKPYVSSKLEKLLLNAAGNDMHEMLRDTIAGRLDSWAVRWGATMMIKGGYTLYPRHSFVDNIGFDGSGVHSGSNQTMIQQTDLSTTLPTLPDRLRPSDEVFAAVKAYQDLPLKSIWARRIMLRRHLWKQRRKS